MKENISKTKQSFWFKGKCSFFDLVILVLFSEKQVIFSRVIVDVPQEDDVIHFFSFL